jgi:DNA-binding transcriptional LysR family regulator
MAKRMGAKTIEISSFLRLYADQFSLKVLPVDLPIRPWPVVIVTLKNRTLSPVVERFIECTREVAASIAGTSMGQTKPRRQSDVP